MRNKVLFCLAGFIAFFAGVTWWCWLPSSDNLSIPLSQKPATDVKAVAIANDAFQKLPGWHKNHFLKSLQAFQESCKVFLNIDPQQETGNNHIPLKAKDWHPACIAAKSLSLLSNETAKAFFERWFVPIELSHHRKEGLFTGYYLPTVQGSLIKTKQFTVPIYALPKKHYQQTFTRKEIDNGAIAQLAPVIAWIASDVDRLFLEIEGSGNIQLPDGSTLAINYAGENGARYTSIASIMISRGILEKSKASYYRIKQYLESHPQEKSHILQQNQSFVFFQKLKETSALGAQGIALTQGYSLAIDRTWVPLGAPLWLTTDNPFRTADQFQRLMVAQDIGGAIKGKIRGDIFFGAGKKAILAASNMQSKGRYWLLLPKHVADRMQP